MERVIKSKKSREKMISVFQLAQKNWENANVSSQAAQLAYFVLLSLFPILLVAGNLIPFLPISTEEIMPYVQSAVPPDIFKLLQPILDNILHSSSGTAISFGIVTATWSASSGFNALQQVMNNVYGTEMRKNFIVARIFSFIIALVMIVVLGSVILIFVFGEQVIRFVQEKLALNMDILSEFTSIKWVTTILVLLIVFMILYWLVPNVRWGIKYALPGAVFATVGWLLSSQAFSIYVRFQGGKSIGTGTLSIFIVLMLWLYLIATILLLGGFINVMVYHYLKEIKEPHPDDDKAIPQAKGMKQRRKLIRIKAENENLMKF